MFAPLFNFKPFYEKIMYRACKDAINQMVTVVEFKHIFGHIYDENGPIDLNEELELFYDLQNQLENRYPLFKLKLIAVGLKKGNYMGGSPDEHIRS